MPRTSAVENQHLGLLEDGGVRVGSEQRVTVPSARISV
jgi:hypothetical protein